MFFQFDRFKKSIRTISLLSMILLISHSVKAESPSPPASISNPFVIILVVVILMLAVIIGILANVVMGAAFGQAEKEKETVQKVKTSVASSAAVMVGLLFLVSPALAQDKTTGAAAVTNIMNGISTTAFYMIAGVIFVELIVILALLYSFVRTDRFRGSVLDPLCCTVTQLP